MKTPSLFDQPEPEPTPPHVRGSATSKAAAEQIRRRVEVCRRAVLDCIRSKGRAGATDDEAQQATGYSGNTQRPRRVELVKAGLVKDSGETRRTAAGRQATVWVATEFLDPIPPK